MRELYFLIKKRIYPSIWAIMLQSLPSVMPIFSVSVQRLLFFFVYKISTQTDLRNGDNIIFHSPFTLVDRLWNEKKKFNSSGCAYIPQGLLIRDENKHPFKMYRSNYWRFFISQICSAQYKEAVRKVSAPHAELLENLQTVSVILITHIKEFSLLVYHQ